MKKTAHGFTIVELLIVIVVIAILAAISIVAYNGIQQRAKNSQTESALAAWVKALNLYKIENSRWPAGYACLGEGYGRGLSGDAGSGFQCRQDGAGGAYENATFNTAMEPYLGGNKPTPAFVTAVIDGTTWRRGLSYLFGGGAGNLVYIIATYDGALSACPTVSGLTGSRAVRSNGNTDCTYNLGFTTDT